MVATIVVLSRRMVDPIAADPTRPFDAVGAILSAVGMFCVVFGILQADTDVTLMVVLLAAGAAFLAVVLPATSAAASGPGKEPLLSTGLFRNRISNLGLATQNIQWLLLMGVSFAVSVFLQTVRGYNAIQTGVVFTAATVGVLASSLAAERLAKRRPQRTLIIAGFVVTIAGIGAAARARRRLLARRRLRARAAADRARPRRDADAVGQRRAVGFPESLQGEISGLSRSVSNLGSSFGTAIAGTILVSDLASGNGTYVVAMIFLGALALIGLAAAARLPRDSR